VSDDEWIGVRETARRLGVHENTVRNWAHAGVLTSRQTQGTRGWTRLLASDVDRLAAMRRVDPVEHELDGVAEVYCRDGVTGDELARALASLGWGRQMDKTTWLLADALHGLLEQTLEHAPPDMPRVRDGWKGDEP
jgi:excisionase family DNA binding protein